jgi:hypothetical protein
MLSSEATGRDKLLTQVLEALVDLRASLDALTKRTLHSDEPLQKLREAASRLINLSAESTGYLHEIRNTRLPRPRNADARRVLTGARTGLHKPIWKKEAACLQKFGIDEDELRWATAVAVSRTAWGVRLRTDPNPIAKPRSFELLTGTIVQQVLDVGRKQKNMKRIKGLKKLRNAVNGLVTLCANSQLSAGETYYLSHSLASATLGRIKLPRSHRNEAQDKEKSASGDVLD